MYLLVIFGAIIAIILAMLLFVATGPEPEDHYSPVELESSANSGHSELVRSLWQATEELSIIFYLYANVGDWEVREICCYY